MLLFAVYEFAESKPTIPAKEIEDLDLLAGDMASEMAGDSAEYEAEEDVLLDDEKRVGRDTERSKPTVPAEDDNMTLISTIPDVEVDDGALRGRGKKVRRDTASNSCVKDYRYKRIDDGITVKTVVCVNGCYEIYGVFHPPHRDQRLILPVDCKKK